MNPKLMRVGEKGQSLSAPGGLRMTLVETADSSDGHRLELEWRVPPGDRLVAKDHYHPDGPEVWQLVDGSAGYRLDGAEHTATAPFEFTVPAATSHGHPWNTGDSTLVVRQIIDSPDHPIPELVGGVQGFFETIFAFAQRDQLNDGGEIDDTLQNLLTIHDLLLPGSYIAGPPKIAQRIGLGGIATIAKATGKSPYLEPTFDPPAT
jgi:hypothetical protein